VNGPLLAFALATLPVNQSMYTVFPVSNVYSILL
jgi:hypothetical protein